MKNMKPLSFALIGRSGCGKGTQAKLLMKHFGNLFYISTGNLLRELAGMDTIAGKEVKKILSNGDLIPDFIIIGLWMREICNNLNDGQGILFDGAPRRISEAKQADNFFEFLGIGENFFPILLDISREEAFARLTKRRICKKCGKLIPWVGEFKKLEKCNDCGGELVQRQDDNPEAINRRLDFFDSEVKEVVDYYKKDSRLITINGNQPIEKVFEDILKALPVK
jgi:adenylate kinase